MWNYKFTDDETGEEFFVQTDTLTEANEIAHEYFERPFYDGKYTDIEAEWYGLDTY